MSVIVEKISTFAFFSCLRHSRVTKVLLLHVAKSRSEVFCQLPSFGRIGVHPKGLLSATDLIKVSKAERDLSKMKGIIGIHLFTPWYQQVRPLCTIICFLVHSKTDVFQNNVAYILAYLANLELYL